jgi:hypothetical protein
MLRFLRSVPGAATAIGLAIVVPAVAQAQSTGGSWFPFKLPGLATGSVGSAPSAQGVPTQSTPIAPGSADWSGES